MMQPERTDKNSDSGDGNSPTLDVSPPADSEATVQYPGGQETGVFRADGTKPTSARPAEGAAGQATTDFEPSGATQDSLASVILAPPVREMPTVPGYKIISELGRGAMGVVYKAKQHGLNRTVALKMVLAGAHASPEKLERFQTEAQAVARVQHPNIVQIYEVGEHDGLPYFSLEFVDGGPLDKLINREPQKPREAAKSVEQIARAMQFAHERNIIHRDLKPANILVTATGVPKVTDFGLAKAVEDDDSHTRSGTILGSPSYMAPEQARGDVRHVGPHSDQYGVGAVLYEMLTGRPPFQGSTVFETLEQVQSSEPVPPRQLAPRVPIDLETICLKCLQKEPSRRYSDCGELADDLQRFLNGEPIQARPVSSAERLVRWCRRNPKLAALTATTALLLVLGFAISTAFAVTFAEQKLVITKEKKTSDNLRILAQQETREAEKQTKIAKAAAVEEKRQRDIAEAARKAADESAQLSSQQATLALNTIQTLVSTVQQKLAEVPGTQQVKVEVLQLAMRDLTRVADNINKSTSKEATMLAVYNQLGKAFKSLGETEKAADLFRRGVGIARERVVIKEGSDASRSNLAASLRELADVTQEIGRDMPATLKIYEEALSVRQDIFDNPKPGEGAGKRFLVKYELAEDHTRVGATIYRLGDPARALPHFQKAHDLRKELIDGFASDPDVATFPQPQRAGFRAQLDQDLSRSILALGEVRFRLGDTAGAMQAYTDGLGVRQRLYDSQKSAANKFELARTQGNFGDIHLTSGDTAEAEKHFGASLAHMQELVAADKDNALFQRDLGLVWYRLGNLALRQNDAAKAAENFGKSREVREALAAKDEKNERRQMELMLVLAHCSEHTRAAEMAAKFRASSNPDNELLLDVARTFAQCAAASDQQVADDFAAKALEAIDAAINQGYKDHVYIEREPDFEPLRDRPEMQALLDRIARSPSGEPKA